MNTAIPLPTAHDDQVDRLLREAGLSFVAVDRCPHAACTVCAPPARAAA
jgi:hypothetical protein